MDPITYTIPEAAKILRCNEENILYMGSRGAFSINILCSIFSLFYLKLPINIDEPWEYPSDFEVEVPWDEDSRFESNQMPLSLFCLTRYYQGDLEAKAVIASSEYDESTRLYFGLYDSQGDMLKLKDCKLVVVAKDVNKIRDGLNVKKESVALIANQIEVDATNPDSQNPESSENILPVIKQKINTVTIYDKRKISFEKWSNDSGVNLESYSKESVFRMLVNASKNESLWKAGFETFKRDFYQRYSKEIGLKKSSGAPPRRK